MKREYSEHGLALCSRYERAMVMKEIDGPKRYEIYRGVIQVIHEERKKKNGDREKKFD